MIQLHSSSGIDSFLCAGRSSMHINCKLQLLYKKNLSPARSYDLRSFSVLMKCAIKISLLHISSECRLHESVNKIFFIQKIVVVCNLFMLMMSFQKTKLTFCHCWQHPLHSRWTAYVRKKKSVCILFY